MNDKKANGVETPKGRLKPVSLEQVKQWVKRDCNNALLLLEAIYRDPNTLDAVSEYLHGRHMNAVHKEELEQQKELDLAETKDPV